ncbi:uncharacterized protein CANTADRAFT_24480 [Suhomyces tanzawaensis NRRL Y-17324]|uniref:Uncharacterized protein n=1 Tax=Suhomyces tanzawaensis NRRL Y-17324 TaxID=984487 RepID=A0A1E4SQ87_9ASCO|nr:uncharacterized protein CANTADRAFT_24480 [Suhomyces tanzawaensis NRRL Y-17324]ODV81597.1 hypothetical protein CANTADRAFT_24480 [Suhomyces tanzawaensis NRRL Y-17324]
MKVSELGSKRTGTHCCPDTRSSFVDVVIPRPVEVCGIQEPPTQGPTFAPPTANSGKFRCGSGVVISITEKRN